MTESTSYSDKLKLPQWKARRDEIVERDNGQCRICPRTETLQVHHLYYISGKDPWDYPGHALLTLCDPCHKDAEAIRTALLKLMAFMPLGYMFNFTNSLAARILNPKSHYSEIFIAMNHLLTHPDEVVRLVEQARKVEEWREADTGGLHGSQFQTPRKFFDSPLGKFFAGGTDAKNPG